MRTDTEIRGATLISLEPHADERGRFVEIMRAANFPDQFVQANHSRSRAGVLRGLHYHRHQADLWYVVSGRPIRPVRAIRRTARCAAGRFA